MTHHELLHHDLSIVLGIGRRGDRGRELGEEGGATDTFEKFLLLHPRRKGEYIYRLMLAEELEHGLENCFVLFEIKRGWGNNIEHFIDCIWPKHDGTDKRHLRFHAMWRDAKTSFLIESEDVHAFIVATLDMTGKLAVGEKLVCKVGRRSRFDIIYRTI